jgi:hypothetical protein
MAQKIDFKLDGQVPVYLELFIDSQWTLVCKVEMCAIEDNELARDSIDTQLFEPVIYLRCHDDLDDSVVRTVQNRLSSNLITYCRLSGDSVIIREALHFKVLRIREFYRCSRFVQPPRADADRNEFQYRWMVTGLAANPGIDLSP